MVIPPPPPPPPLQQPAAVLSSGERKTTSAPRRVNNPVPQAPKPTRPTVDPKALQHAAARLRKTGYNESVRGDVEDLPDGRVDRPYQQLPQRDWSNGSQLGRVELHETGEKIPPPPSDPVHTGQIGYVHRYPDPLSGNNQKTPAVNSSSYSPPIYSTHPEQHPNSILASQNVPKANYGANFATFDVITTKTSSNYSNPAGYSTTSTTVPANFRSYHKDDHVIDSLLKNSANNNVYETPNETRNGYGNRNETVISWTEPYLPGKSSAPPLLNPREVIHDYATTNFVTSQQESPSTYRTVTPNRDQARSNISNSLAKQLRDEGLTTSQKYANQFQKSTGSSESSRLPFDAGKIVATSFNGDEVDTLVHQMRNNLTDTVQYPRYSNPSADTVARTTTSGFSTTKRVVDSVQRYVCVACNQEITGDQPGCNAMGKIFHVDCFKCQKCSRTLAGSSFYNIDDKPVCEGCYQETLEKCSGCGKTIQDKLLRACGGTYHINCFVCFSCKRTLDGIPFTLDKENNVHCVPCFHDKFAPRCAMCSRPIIPQEGEKDSVRVVAMDKSFHVGCYKCEDCGMQLSSKLEGHGCYPLDAHLLCKTCNGNRLRVAGSA